MTIAARVSFSGHETFPFRYTWLKKAVDAVDAEPYALHADDAMVRLGVGKNMVSSIRHWGLATGMLAEGSARRGSRIRPLAPTDLGRSLFLDGGWDPFLEDPGTLWLLHWQLASRPEPATTWYGGEAAGRRARKTARNPPGRYAGRAGRGATRNGYRATPINSQRRARRPGERIS